MCRRRSIVSVLLVLIMAASGVSSMGQSGRGRQLRIQQTLRGEVVVPSAAESKPDLGSARGDAAMSTGETQKTSAAIHQNGSRNKAKKSGEYHLTDKNAGWILLGVLVFESAVYVLGNAGP
jgi:hypothetical protein